MKVLRRRPERDQKVGAATSKESGTYLLRRKARPGTYYARVKAWSARRARNSKTITAR